MRKVQVAKMAEIETIMGLNFFGPTEYQRFYKDDLGKFTIPEIPLEPEELTKACPFYPNKVVAQTHSLILVVPKIQETPLSMMGLQMLHPRSKQPRFYKYGDDSWYRNELFANAIVERPTWALMLNGAIPHSFSKTWAGQQELLPPGYTVPTALMENCKLFFHYLTTSEYLNPTCYVRVIDIDSDGRRLVLDLNVEGLLVYFYWADRRYGLIGLAVRRD